MGDFTTASPAAVRSQRWTEAPQQVLNHHRGSDADETEIFAVRQGRPGNRLAMGAGAMLGGHWQSQRVGAFSHSILGNTRYARLPSGSRFPHQVHRKHSAAAPKPISELRAEALERVANPRGAAGNSPLKTAAGQAIDMTKLAYFTQTFTPATIGFRDVLRQGKMDPNCSVGDFRTRQLAEEPVHEGRLITDATRYREHTLRNPESLRSLRYDSGARYNSSYPSDVSRSSRVRL